MCVLGESRPYGFTAVMLITPVASSASIATLIVCRDLPTSVAKGWPEHSISSLRTTARASLAYQLVLTLAAAVASLVYRVAGVVPPGSFVDGPRP